MKLQSLELILVWRMQLLAAAPNCRKQLAPSLGANCLLGETMWTIRPKGCGRFVGGTYAGAKAASRAAIRVKGVALAIAQAHEERVEETGLIVKRSPSYTTIGSNSLKPTKQGE